MMKNQSHNVFCNQIKRHLNLQEYQSKELLKKYGVNIQEFFIAENVAQASKLAEQNPFSQYIVKAQILAGGRGKGTFSSGLKGGVRIVDTVEEVSMISKLMFNFKLVTQQTPPGGVLVKKLMIGKALDISKEAYLAIVMDRSSGGPVLVCSSAGGVDIEEVSHSTPDLIFKHAINIRDGLLEHDARFMASKLGFDQKLLNTTTKQILSLYKMFIEVDATQIEINPLGQTSDGQVVAFDAKLNFDDNAEFRQAAIFRQDDMSESDSREIEASKYSLNYVGMSGNIACLVNGAGLAMATMDIIKLEGGEPANFLDVGGNVTEDQVVKAFQIIASDPQVKAILVNIFGGIVNCETIANGIKNACAITNLTIPLIVRLEGTNVKRGKEILEKSNLNIITAAELDDAAQKAVKFAH